MDCMCIVGLPDGNRDGSHEYSGHEIKGNLLFMLFLGFFSRVLFSIGRRSNLTIVWGSCICIQHSRRGARELCTSQRMSWLPVGEEMSEGTRKRESANVGDSTALDLAYQESELSSSQR